MRGIDVSYHNGEVNWRAVAAAGIGFAICRAGFGARTAYGRPEEEDETFLRNVEGAHAAGLKCGAYYYSYALDKDEAAKEARHCFDVIDRAGVLLELPVWFDMEDADSYKARSGFSFTRRNVTDICRAFLDGVKPLDCGVYASYSWLEMSAYVDWRALGCAVWNAQWSRRDDLQGYMWQYTESLNIGGKYFDGNILYDDTDRAGLVP